MFTVTNPILAEVKRALRHTDAHILRYADFKIQRYSDTQMHKYTNISILRFLRTQILKYACSCAPRQSILKLLNI